MRRFTRTELAVLAAGAAILAIHGLSFGSYLADDAAISLAYAKNLAGGDGLVLTPGDAPVEGYSNPLWVALLTIGAAAGGADRPEWLLKGTGVLFGAATIGVAILLARRAYGPTTPQTSWVAPLLIAVSTPFAFWTIAGLENPLFAFLLVLAALLYLEELSDARRWAGWSALVLAMLALTRPEGVAFAAAFLVHRCVVRPPPADAVQPGVAVRRGAIWLSVFIACAGLFLLWRYWYFSAWLPNTFYAKVVNRDLADITAYATTAADPGQRYLAGFISQLPVLLALAAIGLFDPRRWRANLLFAGIISTQALFVLYVGGDWWPGFRFLTAIVPLVAVLAQHGIELVVQGLRLRRGVLVASAVAFVACATPNLRTLEELWRADPDSLISLRSRLAHARTVKTLAAIAHLPRPSYLEPDIGGPSLIGGLRIIDLAMLADVHLARFHHYFPFFRQYIFEERRPDFIRTHSTWSRKSRLESHPEFRRDYLTVWESGADGTPLKGLFVRKDRFVRAATPEDVPVARFDQIALVSFEPGTAEVAAGTALPFTWEWRCDPACTRDYRFFVELAPVVRAGFKPVFGWYPTARWTADDVVRTTQAVPLPEGIPPGSYEIRVAASEPAATPQFQRVATVRVTSRLAAARPAAASAATNAPGANVDDRAQDAARLLARAEQDLTRRNFAVAFDMLRRARALDPSSAKIVHRLEDARERTAWIDYYADTRQIDRLHRMYRDEAAAGALPRDPALLEKLYYALLPVVDLAQLPALRRDTGRPAREIAIAEDGLPVVTLLDYRVDGGEWGGRSRLVLYLDVQRAPRRDYQIWIHAYRSGGGPSLRRAIDPAPASSAWVPGRRVESHLFDVPAGEYELRAGFWQPSGPARLCPAGKDAACYLLLGTHRLVK
jgi:hypothetical protein